MKLNLLTSCYKIIINLKYGDQGASEKLNTNKCSEILQRNTSQKVSFLTV